MLIVYFVTFVRILQHIRQRLCNIFEKKIKERNWFDKTCLIDSIRTLEWIQADELNGRKENQSDDDIMCENNAFYE